MPATFVKPLDYSIDILVRTHPTLRAYIEQGSCTEVDPEYALYPKNRPRVMPKDEIQLKNFKSDEGKKFQMSLTKSISGAFINNNDVPVHELPGNFGVRVINTMPTNLRNVFIDQRSNIFLGYACDDRTAIVPAVLPKPDVNDYLTDEESDEANDFEVKLPELDSLLLQFQAEDETILMMNQTEKAQVSELKQRGFEPAVRHEIMNNKGDKMDLLDDNVSKQREQQVALLPGSVSDLNSKIVSQKNKIYLR